MPEEWNAIQRDLDILQQWVQVNMKFKKATFKVTHLGVGSCHFQHKLFYTGEISPGILCPDMGSLTQESHGPVGKHPEEGHKSNPRDETPLL